MATGFKGINVNFTMMPNEVIGIERTITLTRRAEGLYWEIYHFASIPNFKLTKAFLLKRGEEGETAFESMWKELKEKGYLKLNRHRTNEGTKNGFIYEYELLKEPDLDTPSIKTYNTKGELVEDKNDNEKEGNLYPPDFVGGTTRTGYKEPVYNNTNLNNTNLNNINNKSIKEKNIKKEAHKYGEYSNVLLTDDELEKLKTEFPNDYLQRIESLSCYIASKGVSYKNHLATIRNWAKKDNHDTNINSSKASYDIDEYENDWKNHQADMLQAFMNKGKTVSNAV